MRLFIVSNFSIAEFQSLLQNVTNLITGQALNKSSEQQLNNEFSPSSKLFAAIVDACHAGIAAGAMCQHEAGGIKYGRVIKPTPELAGYSVDLVEMHDVKGPHHRHPLGEIDLIMPIDNNAKFDNRGAGWLVYGPDSSHSPTVTEGKALVLYLLPNGEIEFTRTAK